MKNNDASLDLRKEIWNLIRKIDLDSSIKPLNILTEKEKFFDKIKKNKEYNPIFEYKKNNNKEHIYKLKTISSKISGQYSEEYMKIINHVIEWDEVLSTRNEESNKWLFSLHGQPDEQTILQAKETITDISNKKINHLDDNKIHTDYAISFFKKELNKYKYTNWSIEETSMPAKVSIDSLNKKILINKDVLFSSKELKRLAVHEIGTHILRYENGSFQHDPIFQYGFLNYIETEEGLAIYSEYITKNLSLLDLKKYCLRVLACSLVKNHSFHFIYHALIAHTTPDEAFTITMRVKRGLTDTSLNFGYTKDQVYFSGFNKIKKLNTNDIKELYIGKVGLSDLKTLNSIKISTDGIVIPNWIN